MIWIEFISCYLHFDVILTSQILTLLWFPLRLQPQFRHIARPQTATCLHRCYTCPTLPYGSVGLESQIPMISENNTDMKSPLKDYCFPFDCPIIFVTPYYMYMQRGAKLLYLCASYTVHVQQMYSTLCVFVHLNKSNQRNLL